MINTTVTKKSKKNTAKQQENAEIDDGATKFFTALQNSSKEIRKKLWAMLIPPDLFHDSKEPIKHVFTDEEYELLASLGINVTDLPMIRSIKEK